jgi:hypothetical protein
MATRSTQDKPLKVVGESTTRLLELSCTESLIDDVTQVIQRTPFICRYPSKLWTAGLASEFADAVDRLNLKVAELQGADR